MLIHGGGYTSVCHRIIHYCGLIKPHLCGFYSCISFKKKDFRSEVGKDVSRHIYFMSIRGI